MEKPNPYILNIISDGLPNKYCKEHEVGLYQVDHSFISIQVRVHEISHYACIKSRENTVFRAFIVAMF